MPTDGTYRKSRKEEATASYYFASKAIHLIMGQNTNDIQDRHEKIARISKSPRSFSALCDKKNGETVQKGDCTIFVK